MIVIPVKRGQDNEGPFYRWGDSGKKYHYTQDNEESRKKQHEKQAKQGQQIKISQQKTKESINKILDV